MNSLRLWVLLLALVSFAAGAAAGIWFMAARTPRNEVPGPFEDYRKLLVQTFVLGPEREHHLDTVLAAYARDLQDIKDRAAAETMSSMEKELEERGRYYRGLIQDRVLPESQRERFALLAQGLPTNQP